MFVGLRLTGPLQGEEPEKRCPVPLSLPSSLNIPGEGVLSSLYDLRRVSPKHWGMVLLRPVGLLSGGASLSPLRVKASTHRCGGRGCCPSSFPTLACMGLGISFPLPSL